MNTNKLFTPVIFGELTLPNRIVMAPLTRCRASSGRVPNELMREYYVQRASAGLIITEATAVTTSGVGYINTPGIWSDEQVNGWRKITDGVHNAGGRIICQLWHVGRLSHPDFIDGLSPLAPSAIAASGDIRVPTGHKPYPVPRAATLAEIKATIEEYRRGAQNAQRAGFDGVEIHGANGYLPDQFLRDGSNQRTDEYGGPVEQRARFLLEATDAAISVWGAGRVGVHLSPRALAHHSIDDSNPAHTFGYVAEQLGKRRIAFIFTRESINGGPRFSPEMKRKFGGPLIANEQLSLEQAETLLANNEADAASWGQLFIANPDLPQRFATNAPLNKPIPETFYPSISTYNHESHKIGYTDYPTLTGIN